MKQVVTILEQLEEFAKMANCHKSSQKNFQQKFFDTLRTQVVKKIEADKIKNEKMQKCQKMPKCTRPHNHVGHFENQTARTIAFGLAIIFV